MRRATLCLLACVIALPACARAQDAPKTTTKPAAGATGNYAELVKQRAGFITSMKTLQKDMNAAIIAKDAKQQEKVRGQALPLVDNYTQKILPVLGPLAVAEYTKDGTNATAEEVSLEYLDMILRMNRYAEVAAAADKLIAAGRSSVGLLSIGGVAQFATHGFAKAKDMLSQAVKEDPEAMQGPAGTYLPLCDEYAAYWKAEQAIRAQDAKANDLPQVVFKTSRGDIVFELFENEAPNTVANFISLVESKFYDGTKFHRVIPNFMAQGGDPNSKDDDPSDDGQGGPMYNIRCECYAKNARKHFAGSLSMAHAGKDTGGSQFFITHLPTPHLNPNVEEQKGHTVFGRIIKGLDIAQSLQVGDQLVSAKILRKRDHEYKPKKV